MGAIIIRHGHHGDMDQPPRRDNWLGNYKVNLKPSIRIWMHQSLWSQKIVWNDFKLGLQLRTGNFINTPLQNGKIATNLNLKLLSMRSILQRRRVYSMGQRWDSCMLLVKKHKLPKPQSELGQGLRDAREHEYLWRKYLLNWGGRYYLPQGQPSYTRQWAVTGPRHPGKAIINDTASELKYLLGPMQKRQLTITMPKPWCNQTGPPYLPQSNIS